MTRRRGAAVAVAAALVLAATLPWGDVQDHPHWFKVAWIPFTWPEGAPPPRGWFPVLRDIGVNLLLYAPLGAAIAAGGTARWWAKVAGTALLLSIAAESAQVYSHLRFPSATDVACNVVGAMAGAAVVVRRRARRRSRAPA